MVQRHGESDKDDLNTWEKDIIEKTHIFLCKQSLGVNKQCRNVDARNELELSMDMAELNKPNISQKVKMLMW